MGAARTTDWRRINSEFAGWVSNFDFGMVRLLGLIRRWVSAPLNSGQAGWFLSLSN
jgi:hypothetical protein